MWVRGHTLELSYVPKHERWVWYAKADRHSYRPAWSLLVWPFALHYSGPVRPEKRRS